MAKRILFIFTSNDRLVNTSVKTGWYLPEAAHPYYGLVEKGVTVDFVSEMGGRPPLDPQSILIAENDPVSKKFLEDDEVQSKLESAPALNSIKLPATEYSGIFYPGGQGPLLGLPDNPISQNLIRTFYEDGRIVAAICHAPGVLTNVKLSNGEYLVAGRKVTSMSNREEEAWGRVPYVPWLVQTRLGERGALFDEGKKLWADHVVVDEDGLNRVLVTGANPASGGSLAAAINEILERK